MNELSLLGRIHSDPRILDGKPVVRGTRLPVETVLKRLAGGETPEVLLREHARLEPEDIRACLLFAGQAVEDCVSLPLSAMEA
ncbi:MAG: DUF433 domain-containing protein [Limisphaerales bacterium]